jgi:hypothetical protein
MLSIKDARKRISSEIEKPRSRKMSFSGVAEETSFLNDTTFCDVGSENEGEVGQKVMLATT